MNWRNWFSKGEPTTGILFGFDPPPGCRFKVHCYQGQAWFVEIRKGFSEVVRECVLIGHSQDDEALIAEGARRALESYERQTRRADLEGMYPPKRAPK